MTLRIAILAAMPQETGPLLKRLPGWRRLGDGHFPSWVHRSQAREFLLVETGMGNEPAAQAAAHIVSRPASDASLDLILSVGFAGALSPELAVGDLVWSRELAAYDPADGNAAVRYLCDDHPSLRDLFADHAVRPARFITVDRLRPKATMAGLAGGVTAVTEMESTPIAEVAFSHNIAYIGLRAISDELCGEIEWDLDSIADRRGRVRLSKLPMAIVRQPGLTASLARLWRDSKTAGDHLAEALAALLTLPDAKLQALVAPNRSTPSPA